MVITTLVAIVTELTNYSVIHCMHSSCCYDLQQNKQDIQDLLI